MERAFIVGVNLDGDSNFELSMDELASLAQACEMEVVGKSRNRIWSMPIQQPILVPVK